MLSEKDDMDFPTFNRTSVELKYKRGIRAARDVNSFNRTSVELK